MSYRRLQIVWSVLWGVLTALFVVLWVRSYWWQDVVAAHVLEPVCVSGFSCEGRLVGVIEVPHGNSGPLVVSSLYLPRHPGLASAWKLQFLGSYFDAARSANGSSLE